VTTRLVQVNVVVHDKNGKPVTGLTKDDFVLLDGRRERQITMFSVESNAPLERAETPLPPNIYSNEPDRQAGAPTSLTVILFDVLNTKFQDQVYARDHLIKFLEQLQPSDRVAIYRLATDVRVLHDFSNDATSLLRALGRYKGRVNTEVDASTREVVETGNAAVDAVLNANFEHIAIFYLRRRVEITADAIEAIANHLAAFPGRKNLIWVSGSFPFTYGADLWTQGAVSMDAGNFASEVMRAARAVNNANMAIYPVDARGLLGPADIWPSYNAATPGASARLSAMRASIGDAVFKASIDSMTQLADRTGGRAFYNRNDIMRSIRQAIDDSRVTYALGFYPREEDWDNKFHNLRVRVKRPGVEVRYRQGFYAVRDQVVDNRQREEQLNAAARSPLEATQLALWVRLLPPESPGQLRFDVMLDPRQLTFERRDGRFIGSINLAFVQRSVDGKQLKTKSELVELRLADSTYQRALAEGMVLGREWTIEPGAEQMRVVVCDSATALVGSITVPLKNGIMPGKSNFRQKGECSSHPGN